MDLIIHSPNVIGAVKVDLTVVSALSMEALSKGAGIRDGVAASLAEADKEDKYSNTTVVGFAVEDHGRLGESALELVRALAPAEPSARSTAIRSLHQALSSTLQRAAADAVIAATVGVMHQR